MVTNNCKRKQVIRYRLQLAIAFMFAVSNISIHVTRAISGKLNCLIFKN